MPTLYICNAWKAFLWKINLSCTVISSRMLKYVLISGSRCNLSTGHPSIIICSNYCMLLSSFADDHTSISSSNLFVTGMCSVSSSCLLFTSCIFALDSVSTMNILSGWWRTMALYLCNYINMFCKRFGHFPNSFFHYHLQRPVIIQYHDMSTKCILGKTFSCVNNR